ncbi:hypothetical protein EDB81DRAFT_750915 [Dactylonectria macrodidyma]|uniref:Uncharacterized protein n=1 Tax=Dactylonectria macrodidyma TaxID=307937 RepID=A0A9P9FSV2_9HYPO|nr:hypothetical protein EDB81DRAFT_750915 [Dactylonectria macrodidyma]
MILALLFVWNLLLSAGLLFSPRDFVPMLYSAAPSLPSDQFPLAMALVSIETQIQETASSSNATELQVRTDEPTADSFKKCTRLAMKVAAVTNVGFGLWGVYDDCRNFSEGPGVKSGIKCTYGAVSSATALGAMVHGFVLFGGKVYDMGIIVTNKVYRREVEEGLSNKFNTEARHISDWDGSMPWDTVKRDVTKHRPVFGFTMNGKDLHFSQVFDKRGLDFAIRGDPHGFNDNYLQIDPDSQQDFDWIYKQVECYLGLENIGSLLSTNPIDIMGQLNAIGWGGGGVHFQVLNDKEHMTMAMGAIAPFSDTQGSKIDEIDVDEIQDLNDFCTTENSMLESEVDYWSFKHIRETNGYIGSTKGAACEYLCGCTAVLKSSYLAH